ncbi:putative E3 ubiquitin-protein ligase WAVH2 [Silene latifolia]|uniref:putative E3 ubiquitin-protein ligase WAVH2 n=1 Tax=Silene latifolia TaxID=37657 RepID=UPI003D779CB3
MKISYNDDEPVTAILPADSGLAPEQFVSEKIAVEIFNKADAALEKTDYRLVVELMGSGTGDRRCGVDIVAVLDVSYSMWGKRLEKLKTSMNFLVKKLSPIDRLSIVTFSSKAVRLCPLTTMDKNGQPKIEMLINKLEADSYTNITLGLETALSVLAQRRQYEGRTTAIMLVSDGEQSSGYDHPSTVDVSGVPVYTFGLGTDHDSKVLYEIASRSDKGTYSIADVEGPDSASLNIAFSSCRAGILSVVVQDLELTVTQLDSDIQDVRAGNYDQTRDNESVTISFGNLYNRETRRTTVFLSLPLVPARTTSDILRISYSFRSITHLNFIDFALTLLEPVQLINEVVRGDTANSIIEARKQADIHNYDEAKTSLKNRERSLDKLNPESNALIKALKYEVQEFLRLLVEPEIYSEEGRAFALSSNRLMVQRF